MQWLRLKIFCETKYQTASIFRCFHEFIFQCHRMCNWNNNRKSPLFFSSSSHGTICLKNRKMHWVMIIKFLIVSVIYVRKKTRLLLPKFSELFTLFWWVDQESIVLTNSSRIFKRYSKDSVKPLSVQTWLLHAILILFISFISKEFETLSLLCSSYSHTAKCMFIVFSIFVLESLLCFQGLIPATTLEKIISLLVLWISRVL